MKTKPPFYQLKAFSKGLKPGIYDVWRGRFESGKFIYESSGHRNWGWRCYYWKYNRLLRKYNYLHVERMIDGAVCQSFYVFHDSPMLTDEMLADVSAYHREIGLAVGIPEFAVEDFLKRGRDGKSIIIRVKRLGLVFTMCDNEQNRVKLNQFLAAHGLTMNAVQIC